MQNMEEIIFTKTSKGFCSTTRLQN